MLFAGVSATTVAFWRVNPLAGQLMLPYLAFTGFANALNWNIWKNNPTVSTAQGCQGGLQITADHRLDLVCSFRLEYIVHSSRHDSSHGGSGRGNPLVSQNNVRMANKLIILIFTNELQNSDSGAL